MWLFRIQLQNRSQEMRTITTILSANSVYYTGVTARRLGRSDRQFVLQPGGRTYCFFFLSAPVCFSDTFPAISNAIGETLQVRISWDEYRDKIVDYGHIKIFAMASVQETKQSWSEEDDFQLEKPKLDVQV
jgi:transglutaminase 1